MHSYRSVYLQSNSLTEVQVTVCFNTELQPIQDAEKPGLAVQVTDTSVHRICRNDLLLVSGIVLKVNENKTIRNLDAHDDQSESLPFAGQPC